MVTLCLLLPTAILYPPMHSTTSLVTFVTRASIFELDTDIAPISLAKDHYRASFNDYFILSLILCLHSMILSNNVLCYMLNGLIIWLVVILPFAQDQLTCHLNNLGML